MSGRKQGRAFRKNRRGRDLAQRNRRSVFEQLENRSLLAVSVLPTFDSAANKLTVKFGGSSDDTVYLRTASGRLEWSIDNTNYSGDFNSSTAGDQLATLSSFGSLVVDAAGPKLNLQSIALGGSSFEAKASGQLDVGANAVVSTRKVAANQDPKTATSTGASGAIKLSARVIHVGDGSSILAQANAGFAAGNVTLVASDEFDNVVADVLIPFKSRTTRAEIIVGAANIKGNDISVSSLASNRKIVEMPTDLTKNSRAIATGDVNGDGKIDLVVGNAGQPLQLFLGDGAGGYGNGGKAIGTDVFNTTSVLLVDVDGDNDLDLIAGNFGQANRLYTNPGNGQFTAGQNIGSEIDLTTSLAAADINRDGRVDLIVGNDGQANRLYLGTPSGFAAPSLIGAEIGHTRSIAVGDFNGDTNLDLLVGNYGEGNRIYASNSAGVFSLVGFIDPFADQTQSVAIGDLNGDSVLDFVAANNGVTRWYAGNGSFGFTAASLTETTIEDGNATTEDASYDARSVKIVDWNRDGRNDIVLGIYNLSINVYRNDGSGNPFDMPVTVVDGDVVGANPAFEQIGQDGFVTAIAIADMDGDSRPDVVAACDNQLGQTILNKSGGATLTAIGPTQFTEQVTEQKVFPISLLASVTLVDSGSSVVFGAGSNLDAARDVIVRSDALANATNITVSSVLAAAYVRSLSSGTIHFAGADSARGLSAAQVKAGRDVDVDSTSTNTIFQMVAAVGLGATSFAQVTLAYGKARSTSETIVDQGVSITGREISLDATNRNNFLTSVISAALQPNAPEFLPNVGLGFGFSIGDYESNATTRVDGTIRAAGSVAARADAINVKNATNASASVTNTPTLGSIAKYFQKKGLQKKLGGNFDANVANARARDYKGPGTILWSNKELPIAVGGAITIAQTDNDARAILGSTADIIASGSLTVFARAEDNYQVYACGAAGEAEISIGGGVCVAIVTNQSEALIQPGAKVDASGTLSVRSEAVVPNQVSAFNLGLDLNDGDDTGLDASGKVTRRYDDGVTAAEVVKVIQDSILALLSSASMVGGTVSTTMAHSVISPSQRADGKLGVTFGININRFDNDSKAAIESGAEVNQRTGAVSGQDVKVESFSHVETINLAGLPTLLGLVGEPGASQNNAAGGHLDVISHQTNAIAYIADGAKVIAGRDIAVTGSTFNWMLTAAQSGGKSGDISVEGSIGFVSIGAETYAYIEDQAEVSAGRDLAVTADNDTFVIDVAGALVLGGATSIGVGVALAIVDNNTHAFIGDNPYDNVASTSPAKTVNVGRDTTVTATSDQKFYNFVLSASVVAPFDLGPKDQANVKDGKIGGGLQEEPDGKSFGIGVSAVAALTFLDDDVSAFVASPVVTGNDLSIKAENTTLAISSGGALAIAASAGSTPSAGGAYAANFITKSAHAYLSGVNVTAGGDVSVNSHSENTVLTFAASGSGSARSGAIAGSVITTALINDDRALISAAANVVAQGGVTVNADNKGRVISVAGAGGGGGGAFGVGAALSIVIVDNTSIASIGGFIDDLESGAPAQVQAGGDVRVTSLSDDFVLTVSAAIGLAVQSGVGVAGSISTTTLSQNVQSLVGSGSRVTTPASMLLDSEANADFGHIVGAGAGGSKSAIGATITNTNLIRTNRAAIGNDATIVASGNGAGLLDRHNYGGHGLVVDATSDDTLVTIAVGAAISTQGAGVGASVNVTTVTSDVLATVGNGTNINADNTNAAAQQAILIRALTNTDILTIAGGAGGSTLAGVGAAIDITVVKRNARATVGNDTVLNAKGLVDIEAHSDEGATSIVFGVGVGTQAAGVAGSVSTVNIEGDTEAKIGDRAAVNANGSSPPIGEELRVLASGDVDIFSLAGAVGIGKEVGVGAGVSAGGINTTVHASIGEGAQVKVTSAVVIGADSQEKIVSFSTNAGGGRSAGIAGSIDVWQVDVDVRSTIGNRADVWSEGTVAVTADGATQMNSLAGAASGSGIAGVGAAVAVLVLDKDVVSFVGDGAHLTALGQRGGQWAADSLGENYIEADTFGGDVSPPSSNSTFVLDTDGDQVNDIAKDDPNFSKKRESNIGRRFVSGLIVTATNRQSMNALAVSGGGSGVVSVSVGGAVSVDVSSTKATLGNDVTVNTDNTGAGADQDVQIVALSDISHLGVTAAATGAGATAVVPGVDVIVVDSVTDAGIGQRGNLKVAGNVSVMAHAVETVLSVSAGAAVGGSTGVAGMVSVPSLTSHVTASVGQQTVVDAGGTIAVIALDDTKVTSIVGSLGIGFGAAGVGGGVGVLVISKETQAWVGDSAKLTSRGTAATMRQHGIDENISTPSDVQHDGILVYARGLEDVLNVVAAGGGGYAAGVAGAVQVTSIESTTTAEVGHYAELRSDSDIVVLAMNRLDALTVSGAAGVSFAAGVAGGVNVGIVQNQASAIIGHDSVLEAGGDALVVALSDKTARSYAVSLGAAAVAGVAGSVSVWSFGGAIDDKFEVKDDVEDGRSGQTTSSNVLSVDNRTSSEYGNTTQYANAMSGGQKSNGGWNGLVLGFTGEGDQQKASSQLNSASTRMQAFAPRTQVDISRHEGGGAQALVGDATQISAGDLLLIRGQEQLSVSSTTGTGAFGLAGVGGAVSIITLSELQQAVVGAGAQLSAPHVVVAADLFETVDGHAYAGTVGVAALGAQVVVLHDHNSQGAVLGDNVVVEGGNATVRATVFRGINLDAVGVFFAFNSLGASAAVAEVDGYTVADVRGGVRMGQAQPLSGNVFIQADSGAEITTAARAAGAGLGPFAIVTGIGANATGKITSNVSAQLGGGGEIHAAGAVRIGADAQHSVNTEALGLAVSNVLGVGAVQSRAILEPSLNASVGSGTGIYASEIEVSAQFNHDGESPLRNFNKANAYARGQAAGGALVAGAAGAGIDAFSNPVITTRVDAGANLHAGFVNLRADASFDSDAKGTVVAAAAGVAIGINVVKARSNGSAAVFNNGDIVATDADLIANVNGRAKAEADAVGGALIAGFTGSSASAAVLPQISTSIGGSSHLNTSHSLDVLAISRGRANSSTGTVAINGIVGVGNVTSRAVVSPNVTTSINSGATVQAAGDGMRMAALHNVDATTLEPLNGVGADAEAGNLFVSIGATILSATIEALSLANVTSTLNPGLQLAGSTNLNVQSVASNQSFTTLNNRTGAAINLSFCSPYANATGNTSTTLLSNALGIGSMTLYASSNDRSNSELQSSGGGIVNVNISSASALAGSSTHATVGGGLSVQTARDFTVESRGISEADASATGASGGVVNIAGFDAYATSNPVVGSVLGDNSSITAGGRINFRAQTPLSRNDGNREGTDLGDGYTTAASASRGGGFISVNDANSYATSTPWATNQIGQNTTLRGDEIVIAANGTAASEALTVGASGGFVAAGGVDAISTQYNHVWNSIGNGARLIGNFQVAVLAEGATEGFGDASADIGGFVSFVSANTTVDLDYDVSNYIGAAEIRSARYLFVRSTAYAYGQGRSDADAGGLGADAKSSNANGQPDAVNQKGVRIGRQKASTLTDIGTNAYLVAPRVEIEANTAAITGRMEARATAGGFGTDADGNSNVDVFDTATVRVWPGALIESNESLDLFARHSYLNAYSYNRSVGDSLFGDSDSTAIADIDSTSSIITLPGSQIKAFRLNVESTYNVSSYERVAERDGAIDFGGSNERGDFNVFRNFDWQGDVTIINGFGERNLVIGSDGSILQNNGFALSGSSGLVYVDSGFWDQSRIGSVRFYSNTVGLYDGKAGFPSQFSSFNNSVFQFNDAMGNITIDDRRQSGFLQLSPIDVINPGFKPTITMEVESVSIVNGMVFQVKRNYAPTTINIHSGANIVGTRINNPIGDTTIEASLAVEIDKIVSHNLTARSPYNIGRPITEFVNGQLTTHYPEYELTHLSTGLPHLDLNAGTNIYGSITVLSRVPNQNDVLLIDNLTARGLYLRLNEAKIQSTGGGVGPIWVDKTRPSIFFFSMPQGAKDVYTKYVRFSQAFGTVFDPQEINLDVFGTGTGTQSSWFRVQGLFHGSDVEQISLEHSAVIEYLDFGMLSDMQAGITPGTIHEWGDINGDGVADLVSAAGSSIFFVRNDTSNGNTFYATSTRSVQGTIESMALADFDLDGDLDLALQSGNVTSLLTNLGGGVFSDPTPLPFGTVTNSVGDLAWIDFDNDGDLDLLDAGTKLVIHRFTDGVPGEAITVAETSYSRVDIGDYDLDGDLDILAGGRGNTTRIWRNEGGTFVDSGIEFAATVNGPILFGDGNGDGDLDVLVMTAPKTDGTNSIITYDQKGGVFKAVDTVSGQLSNVLWFDHNGDGILDLMYRDPNNFFSWNRLRLRGATFDFWTHEEYPYFYERDVRYLPTYDVPLSNWSLAPINQGGGIDLVYSGNVRFFNTPFNRVYGNSQPIWNSGPPAPSVSLTAFGSEGKFSWTVPASSTSNSYSYNLRIQKVGGPVMEVSTANGRGALSGNGYLLNDLTIGASYTYSMQTVDSVGRRSAWSTPATFVNNPVLTVNVDGAVTEDVNDGDIFDGHTTLREAIEFSNSQGGGFTIVVNAGFNQPIVINPLTITAPVKIQAGNFVPTIAGNGTDRLFLVDDQTSASIDVSFSNLKLTGGRADNGAAIYAKESLTLDNVSLTDNRATVDGGAIYLDLAANGRAALNIASARDNHADRDGGIIAVSNAGNLEFVVGTAPLQTNSAGRDGGAISIANASTGQVRTRGAFSQELGYTSAGRNGGAISVVDLGGLVELNGFRTTLDSAAGLGGGMYLETHDGTITVSQRHSGNTANLGGNFYVLNDGGSVAFRNATAESSTAQSGGGMYIKQTGGSVTLDEIYIGSNKSLNPTGAGGGVYIENTSGEFNIKSSYFELNQAATGGGLDYVGAGTATASIERSTFASNKGDRGAGVAAVVSGGVFAVKSSTFSGNSLINSAGAGGVGLDLSVSGGANASVVATTIAYNDAAASDDATAFALTAETGTSVLVRNTLVGDNPVATDASAYLVSGDAAAVTNDSNWVGNNAGLKPLAFIGGSTPSHALLPSSPAVNQGADPISLPAIDQRGFARAVGRPDIGAVELQAAGSQTLVVSTFSDIFDGDFSEGNLSLIEAIDLANASAGEDTITFAANLVGGVIARPSSQSILYSFFHTTYAISDSLKILGPGASQLSLSQVNFVIDDGDAARQINFEIAGLSLIDSFASIDSRENTSLRNMIVSMSQPLVWTTMRARPDAGATFRIRDSYLSGIMVDASGPGHVFIENSTLVSGASPVYTNSTLSTVNARTGSHVTVSNSTLLGRRQNNFGQILISPENGGISGIATVESSIVPFVGAGSTIRHSLIVDGDSASLTEAPIGTPDADGNLIGSASGGGIIDPQFGQIGYLGGNIPSAALKAESPAISGGSNPLALANDSRGPGFLRTFGGAIDIGSFESQPLTFVVTITSDEDDGDYRPGDLSLREAIRLSNANAGLDTIRFSEDLGNSIKFPSIPITDSVRIEGRTDRSLTLTADFGTYFGADGVNVFGSLFTVTDDNAARLVDVTLSGFTISSYIVNYENLVLENVTFAGSILSTGVVTEGDLTIRESSITSFARIIVAGDGIDTTNVTLQNVTVAAANLVLNASNATLVLDNFQFATAPYTLTSLFKNVALVLQDSHLWWSFSRFEDAANLPASSLVVDNGSIDGWAPPAISLGEVATDEDHPIDIDLSLYALIDGQPAGTISGVLKPVGGGVSLLADGHTARFEPFPNFNGVASFQYTVSGPNLAPPPAWLPEQIAALGRGKIQIAVAPIDDPFTARSQIQFGVEDQTLDVDLATFITDIDGGPSLTFTLGESFYNAEGILLPDGHTVRLTFGANYNGPAVFRFSVTDGTTTYDDLPVQVDVAPIDDLPVLTLPAGNPVIRPDAIYLLNKFKVADVDSGELTLRIEVTSGSFGDGVVSFNPLVVIGSPEEINAALATFGFSPEAGFIGVVTFKVTLSDFSTDTSQFFELAVRELNPVPQLTVPETVTTDEDTTVDITGLSVIDEDSDSLTITLNARRGLLLCNGEEAATITLEGTIDELNALLSTLRFKPLPNEYGTRTIEITVTDGENETLGQVDVKVLAVNDPPQISVLQASVSILEGMTATNSGDFSDVDVQDSVTLTASLGTVVAGANGKWTWSYHAADDAPARQVTITATDRAGARTSVTFDLIVSNVIPTIAISGGPATLNEGSTFSLTLGAVTDPGTDTIQQFIVHWGDGSSDTYTTAGVKSHLYADGAASHSITVDLVDEDGTFVDRANAIGITVLNVVPSIAISGAAAVDEGSTYSLNLGAVTDPGTDTIAQYIVHWGDGSSDTYTTGGVKSHIYADGPDSHSITVDLVDEDGTFVNRANDLSVVVNNVAPTLTSVVSSQGDVAHVSVDGRVSLTGKFHDPGIDTHRVRVAWGDGVVEEVSVQEASETFSGSHTYARGGIYRVVVTAIDSDGAESQPVVTQAWVQGMGLIDGVLYVIGSEGKDRITVSNAGRRDTQIAAKPLFPGVTIPQQTFLINDFSRIEIYGRGGDDEIMVTLQAINGVVPRGVTIDGGAGNDTMQGGDGNDYLNGGLGIDRLYGGRGADTLVDLSGNNSFWGGEGDDSITAGDGDDQIRGEAGHDTILAGGGKNSVWGGDGNDTITSGDSDDQLRGEAGDDTIVAGGGKNSVWGGTGNDRITTADGDDLLRGEAGNDVIFAGGGKNSVLGGDGDDTITAGDGDDEIRGEIGNDTIFAGNGRNKIVGGAGKEIIWTGSGDDQIAGEAGNDVIFSGGGNDSVDGGDGNDILVGGDGIDVLVGSRGRDILIGGRDKDTIRGGDDDDLLIGDRTSFDEDRAALELFLAQWTSSLSYDARIANLRSGTGIAGGLRLATGIPEKTVFDDGIQDLLEGGAGRDWFFATMVSEMKDKAANELRDTP